MIICRCVGSNSICELRKNIAPSFSLRRLGEDMEVDTKQHERPEKQGQEEV
jgi:hypothetical protein